MEYKRCGGFKGAIALISLLLRIFHDSGEEGPCPHSKALASVYITQRGLRTSPEDCGATIASDSIVLSNWLAVVRLCYRHEMPSRNEVIGSV